MTGMYGADVEQLRSLARQFDDAAARLDATRSNVGGAIQSAAWKGPDAGHFRSDWAGQLSPRVSGAAESLRAAAKSLRHNADSQERTSAADGASAARVTGTGNPVESGAAGGMRPPTLTDVVDGIRGTEIGGVKPWEMLGLIDKGASLIGVQTPFGLIDDTMEGTRLIDGYMRGEPDLYATAHLAAKGFQSIPGPVGQLSGLAIHTVAYAGEQAQKMDFSPATQSAISDYFRNDPGKAITETIGVVGQSTIQVGAAVVGFLNIGGKK